MTFTVKMDGKTLVLHERTSILGLIGDKDPEKNIVAAKVNNRIRDLTFEVFYDCEVELLGLDDLGAMKVYEASLRYVVAMAFHRAYPDLKIRFAYNVSRGIGIHILTKGVIANTAMLNRITQEVEAIVKADYPLKRMVVSNEEAKEAYLAHGYEDKICMLAYRPEKTAHLYSCDGYLNYMYQHMVPSTGYVHRYRIRLYAPGFLIQYPRSELHGEIPEFEDAPTYNRVLRESHEWAKLVNSSTVDGINREIKTLGEIEYINLCEARHNRMLCELGELIQRNIESISLICIAGPSSSGKTTFSNRLRIELLSRGIKPIRISLDDYYVDRDKTPLDENGDPDYESIEALDIDLFNQNMLDLVNGEEVTLPRFDFQLGRRVEGRTLKLGPNEPLIIEGIHALNERMTRDIPKTAKFKIFISPQAQINIDDHTPISLTDLRLIRRIVRDNQFRGTSAEETIAMWPSVRRGEFKWIYPTQEGCDYVYNSMLAYELPVLKKHAMPLLANIKNESPNFPVRQRLVRMLKFFVDISDEWIPNNSLMREFIGGSCYADV